MSPPPDLLCSIPRIRSHIPLFALLLVVVACDRTADLLGIEETRRYPPTLTGHVLDTDSTPVAGAHVEVLGQGRSDKTDASGGFQIGGLSTGKLRLGIHRPGFRDTLLASSLPANLPEPLRLGFLLLPRLTTTLNGSLSNRMHGGVALENQSVSALTDAQGEFRLVGAAPGTTRILAVSGNGACGSTEILASTASSSHVGTIPMDLGCGSVIGRVIDEQGRPVAGATLRAFEGTLSATTDGNGRFRVDGIPPKGRISLRISSPEAVLRLYGIEVAERGTTNLGTLQAGRRSSGQPWIVPGRTTIFPSDSIAFLVADTVLQDSTFRLRRFAWSLDGGISWDSTRENRLRLSRDRFGPLGHGHAVLVRGVALDGRATPAARILLDFQPALDLTPPTLSRLGPSRDTAVRWKDSVLVASWATFDPSGIATASIGDSLMKVVGGKVQRRLVLGVGKTVVHLDVSDSAGNRVVDSVILTRSERDTTPPQVRRLGPSEDTAIRWKDSLIVASWDAEDSSGILAASIQGVKVRSSTGRFSLATTVPVGSSHIVFRVRDSAGVLARDSIMIVRAAHDRAPPSILRLAPAKDTVLAWKDSSILASWEASDASGIGPASIGDSTFPAGIGRYSRRIALPVGTTILRFAVRDSVGWSASDSVRIVRTRFDSTPPSIRRTNPTRDTSLRWKDSLLTVSWEVSDVNGIRVASINDSLLQPVGGRLSRTFLLPVGFSTIRLRVRDSAGFLAVDSLRIERRTRDTVPPLLERILPLASRSVVRFGDSAIDLEWRVEDARGLDSVRIGGIALEPGPDGRVRRRMPLGYGVSGFTIAAWDREGNRSQDSVLVERLPRDEVPPSISRLAPLGDTSVRWIDSTIQVHWTVSDNDSLVEVYLGEERLPLGRDALVDRTVTLRVGDSLLVLAAMDRDGNRAFDTLRVSRAPQDTSRLAVILPSDMDTLRLDDTIRVSSNGPVEYAITTGLWLPFPVEGLVLPRSCTLSVRTQTPNEIPRVWERALVLNSWDPGRTYDTMVDARDGRVYRILTVGSQTWMAENLAYRGPPGATTFVGTCPSGRAEACQAYGRLYTWAEVMAKSAASAKVPSGVQGLCPTGWHVPSDSEWTILVDRGLGSARPGTVLRSRGGWVHGNGTDSVGFHAVAAGHRFLTGAYYQEGEQGYWWTTSMVADTASAWSRRLYGGFEGVYRNYYNKGYGLSLRCLKNP